MERISQNYSGVYIKALRVEHAFRRHSKNSTYCCGQVAAFVSADPAQTADNIEHLELELHKRRGRYIKLPFMKKMHPTETAGGQTRAILFLPVSGNSSDSIFASVLKRFWMLIILESGGTLFQMHAFLLLTVADCLLAPPDLSILPSTS